MSEPLVLVMLLVVLVVPAVLIARTGRRLGHDSRLRRQLGVWAELRGWRLLAPGDQPLGRWQVWPFTAADRDVDEAVAGVHRGRDVTSRRLVASDGPRQGTFHVLTVVLAHPERPRTLVGESVEPPVEGSDSLELLTVLTAVRTEHPDLSIRLEAGLMVGWLPGPPLLGELDAHLDVLADVADLLEQAG